MVRPDWGALDRPSHPPGIYLVRVAECKEGVSKSKGEALLNVRLDHESFDGQTSTLCYDVLMMEGKGASIGLAKALALGFEKGEEIKPEAVVGRRVHVRVSSEEYNGKSRLKVTTTFNPFACGYWPEDSPPDSAADSLAQVEDDPFAPDVVAAKDPVKDDPGVPF